MKFKINAIILLITLIGIAAGHTNTTHASTITTISIPAIGVTAPVYPLYLHENTYSETTWDTSGLRMSTGHLTGLAWFGETGNVAIAGHATSPTGQPDVFYALPQLNIGDVIEVHSGTTRYRYQITATWNVTRTDLSILSQTPGEEVLTLFTCDTESGYQNGDYGRRHVVRAVRIA